MDGAYRREFSSFIPRRPNGTAAYVLLIPGRRYFSEIRENGSAFFARNKKKETKKKAFGTYRKNCPTLIPSSSVTETVSTVLMGSSFFLFFFLVLKFSV